jgi:choline dehydrogenase
MFDSIKYDPSYWGNTSEVHAGWPNFYWPGVTPLVEAFKEIEGVEFPADSGAGQPGVFWFPTFLDPRPLTRSYAETGHYANVNLTRSNYHLLINTLVRQILIDDTLTAHGVQFLSANSTLLNVTASKEVILSAGAVHSPYLLQLSGVGPKSLLEAGGIKVRVDLPGVGQNFQDHSSVTALNITRKYTQLRHRASLLYIIWYLTRD